MLLPPWSHTAHAFPATRDRVPINCDPQINSSTLELFLPWVLLGDKATRRRATHYSCRSRLRLCHTPAAQVLCSVPSAWSWHFEFSSVIVLDDTRSSHPSFLLLCHPDSPMGLRVVPWESEAVSAGHRL